jgi:hypothetical protein
VVALHVAAPFVVYDKAKVGNARFRGLTIDLLEQIAKVPLVKALLRSLNRALLRSLNRALREP